MKMNNYFISYYFVFVNLLFIAAFAFVVFDACKLKKRANMRRVELNKIKEKYRKADMEMINNMNDAIKFLHLKNI